MSTGTLTSFGAPFADPARAAALLRAHASRHGVSLAPVSPEDAAAAAAGAHVLLVAVSAPSLDVVRGGPAAAAAAACLARAAGQASTPCGEVSATERPRGRVLEAVGQAAAWVRSLGLDRAVLTVAGADLAAGGADPRIASAAAALWEEGHAHP